MCGTSDYRATGCSCHDSWLYNDYALQKKATEKVSMREVSKVTTEKFKYFLELKFDRVHR